MERVPVTSSTIRSVGYDAESQTLEIEVTSGSIYQYFDVPEVEHQSLVTASSVGAYLARNIKNRYRYARG